MLSSFEAVNFRTFRNLKLPRLGRVNLIVGRNNTGKTSLLEALRLHSIATTSEDAVEAIQELLSDRASTAAWLRSGEIARRSLHGSRRCLTVAGCLPTLTRDCASERWAPWLVRSRSRTKGSIVGTVRISSRSG
jgi:predicted ATPase